MPFRHFLFALTCAALVSPAAQSALRLFFSPIGAAENESLLDANPGLTLPIPRSNPTVQTGSRLYLWAEMITSTPGVSQAHAWKGISFDLLVSGGRVTANHLYNFAVPNPADPPSFSYEHWQGVHSGEIQPDGSVVGGLLAAVVRGLGVNNSSEAAASATRDIQSEVGILAAQGASASGARSLVAPAGFTGKAMLLGYFDVAVNTGAESASLFLRVGPGGFSRQGQTGAEPIYFGTGDENAGLLGGSFGSTSPLADATVVPEPCGAALLACVGLMRRRG